MTSNAWNLESICAPAIKILEGQIDDEYDALDIIEAVQQVAVMMTPAALWESTTKYLVEWAYAEYDLASASRTLH